MPSKTQEKSEQKGNKKEDKDQANKNKKKEDKDDKDKKEHNDGEKKDTGRQDTARSSKDGTQSERSSKSRKSETPRDGKTKQKEFFKEELDRLEEGLQEEASKIEAPDRKEYQPYVFNNLEPYYNVHSAKFLSQLPEEQRHGYVSRKTALGLCDPWDDHSMDQEVDPKPESKPVEHNKDDKKQEDDGKDRPPKEGSTRLPKYPAVAMPSGDIANKKLYYSDVPALREELRDKYSSSGSVKTEEEYKRTKQDFYRMELDKIEEYHPINRPHMRATYFAYLQNNPGSRKAVHECLKEEEKKAKEKEQQKDGQKQSSSRRGSQCSQQSRVSQKSRASEKSHGKSHGNSQGQQRQAQVAR